MTLDEFAGAYAQLASGGVDSPTYARLCATMLEVPEAAALLGLDPFSPAYRRAAEDVYNLLRGRGPGYDPLRDEASSLAMPANLWTQLTPWSFRDPAFVAEFFFSWGHILHALEIGAEAGLSVLEYGPGSGQLLLFLARLGVAVFGVDIDQASLDVVAAQAQRMELDVRLEQAPFGGGFEGRTFDRILFFEAFHHAIDFLDLIPRLRDRLAPGGRLVFAGEPVTDQPIPSIPYAWGPRLDALSVFCIRHHGWMELGFREDFFLEVLTRSGLDVTVKAFPGCGRAKAYVAQVAEGAPQVRYATFGAPPPPPPTADDRREDLDAQLEAMRSRAMAAEARSEALTQSTSWRITALLRRLASLARRSA